MTDSTKKFVVSLVGQLDGFLRGIPGCCDVSALVSCASCQLLLCKAGESRLTDSFCSFLLLKDAAAFAADTSDAVIAPDAAPPSEPAGDLSNNCSDRAQL